MATEHANLPYVSQDRLRGLSPRTAHLHHPPVRHGRHVEPVLEDGNLEDGHPPEQADFEESKG